MFHKTNDLSLFFSFQQYIPFAVIGSDREVTVGGKYDRATKKKYLDSLGILVGLLEARCFFIVAMSPPIYMIIIGHPI